jgi:hypothetical protein
VFCHSQQPLQVRYRPLEDDLVLVILPLPTASQSAYIVESGHSPHVAFGASDPLEYIQTLSQS